jgi:Cu2+-containing amine oxidase
VLTAQISSLLAHDSSTTIILTATLNTIKVNLTTTAIINLSLNLKWAICNSNNNNSIGVSSAFHIHTDMTVLLDGKSSNCSSNCSNNHSNGSIIPRNLSKPFTIGSTHEPCRRP